MTQTPDSTPNREANPGCAAGFTELLFWEFSIFFVATGRLLACHEVFYEHPAKNLTDPHGGRRATCECRLGVRMCMKKGVWKWRPADSEVNGHEQRLWPP